MKKIFLLFIVSKCASILTPSSSLHVYRYHPISGTTETFQSENLMKRKASEVEDSKIFMGSNELQRRAAEDHLEALEDLELEEYAGGIHTNVARVQPLIGWFLSRASEFIVDMKRAEFEFQTEAEELLKELKAIEVLITLAPFSRQLSQQLRFAKHIYSLAIDARRFLNFHTLTQDEWDLIRVMILLNTFILSLHDVYGIPIPQVPDYADRVSLSIRALEYWKGFFNRMLHMPRSLNIMLEQQFSETEWLLFILAGLVSKSEEAVV